MKEPVLVLIVDDDADDREIIRDAFKASNETAEYITLENGDALIRYLNSRAGDDLPHLIMLDLNMPGKDGRDSLKELKSHTAFQRIPVIVFTTSSSRRDKQTVYELGANCFITKPDTFNKLVEMAGAVNRLWLS